MDRLRIHEIYLSIQGESTFAGVPCVFVRLSGCPLRCTWCDTPYAFGEGEEMTRAAVRDKALGYGVATIEVTGGEPLAQRAVLPLLAELCDAGKTVLLETSGAQDTAPVDERVRIILDVKCPDSGMAAHTHWDNLGRLRAHDEVKFVLASRRDYEFARAAIAEHGLGERCTVLLSSAFGLIEHRRVVEWMLEDGLPARFQLQMHKYVWPPDTRGV